MSRPVVDKLNCAYFQQQGRIPQSLFMLDIAAGILVLTSVGIFVAHAVDAYRDQ
jgi:hypothetical protein